MEEQKLEQKLGQKLEQKLEQKLGQGSEEEEEEEEEEEQEQRSRTCRPAARRGRCSAGGCACGGCLHATRTCSPCRCQCRARAQQACRDAAGDSDRSWMWNVAYSSASLFTKNGMRARNCARVSHAPP